VTIYISFIGGINTFVEVGFNSITKTITCFFPNQSMLGDSKQCIANVTYGPNCDQHLGVYRAEGEGSSVTTRTIDFKDEVSSYCFVVTASSSTATVTVEGNLDLVNLNIRMFFKYYCLVKVYTVQLNVCDKLHSVCYYINTIIYFHHAFAQLQVSKV
jgi:hypothetical protein